MLALVDRRIPGFLSAMRSRIEGSPSTIERYLGKPRGSVAGPKQKMGQHILFRQRSRSPVRGLYFAGEGTVMGTGTPAVTVSGISAANRILRDSGLPAWDSAANPEPSAAARDSAIRVIARGAAGNLPADGTARLAGRCRWCEHPACTAACPAAADIPGLMRRLEHGNRPGFLAAARSCARKGIAEDSLFAACSACPAENPPCQSRCILETPVQVRNIVLASGASLESSAS
jgi:prolycopene isomerase